MVMVFNTTFNTISVTSIQHCVPKFVSDLQHVCRWFSPDTPISSTNKTDRHKILLKVALNPITHPHTLSFDHCIVCPSNCSFIIETTQKYSINIDTTFKLLHKIYSHIYTEDHIKITYTEDHIKITYTEDHIKITYTEDHIKITYTEDHIKITYTEDHIKITYHYMLVFLLM